MKKLLAAAAGIIVLTLPALATAAGYEPVVVRLNGGFWVAFETVFRGLVNVMLLWAMPIAVTLFVFGAFRMAASGGSDNAITQAKSIMKGSLIGFAIIAGSYLILSSILYIIAGS